MILKHFSAQPIPQIIPKYHTENNGVHKPTGFWVSVGDSWKQWCESEDWGLDGLRYEYTVRLKKDANILYISTPKQIDDFTKEYSFVPYPNIKDYLSINWEAVYDKYQGIIIAPYIHERRLTSHTHWYYGWDCASGCIWDTSAIEYIKLLEAVS